MSLSALTPYTVNHPPPPNPYLKLPNNLQEALSRSTSTPTLQTPSSLETKSESTLTSQAHSTAGKSEPAIRSTDAPSSQKRTKNKPPPSRKLIRHLLRARVDATRQLAAFLKRIDKPGVKVSSSGFMATAYGGGQESLFANHATVSDGKAGLGIRTPDGRESPGATTVEYDLNPTGWRYGQEVVGYLKSKGARVGKLIREAEGIAGPLDEAHGEYEFAALSSDGEGSPGSPDTGYGGANGSTEELEWVAPGRK
jgi:glycerol-3-phosphate O-acyltransferase / dihydroxyacetone phosphate acyltransferase